MLAAKPTFQEVVAALLTVATAVVICYLAVTTANETVIGLLGGVLAAATGFYLRGRVEKPEPPPPPEGRNG